jgi:hypothetical protein
MRFEDNASAAEPAHANNDSILLKSESLAAVGGGPRTRTVQSYPLLQLKREISGL